MKRSKFLILSDKSIKTQVDLIENFKNELSHISQGRDEKTCFGEKYYLIDRDIIKQFSLRLKGLGTILLNDLKADSESNSKFDFD